MSPSRQKGEFLFGRVPGCLNCGDKMEYNESIKATAMRFGKRGNEMNTVDFLREVTAMPGLPGHEHAVSAHIARTFAPLADDVRVDGMNNVTARCGDAGPRIVVAAHQDEIGLCVRKIEEDGALRIASSGGVDPRILPAAKVHVWAKDGELIGFVGAKAPHLLTEAERNEAAQMQDMYVDLGMSAEKVHALVRVGDMITLDGALIELANGRIASKTLDDRAGVAAMLCAAEELNKLKHNATALFVSTVQEEVSFLGGMTAGYAHAPDAAIAIDVTHGAGPGTGKWEAFPLTSLVLSCGPSIHAGLFARLKETAKRNGIDCNIEVTTGRTGTDADPLHLVREGIPSVLISIPLRYMHTTVETIDAKMIEQCGRLIALFIRDLAAEWGDIEWY